MPVLRPRTSWGELSMPVAASALLLTQLLLALALIPPWQQPDEPTHVALVELHRNRLAQRDDGPDPGREGEILQSMARHFWWQQRRPGGEPPRPFPEDFRVTRSGTPAAAPGRPLAHAKFAARILRWFPPFPVVEDLYLLRTMSAVLGLLTLRVAWLGARECLGALGGAIVAAMLALHPQFSIVSTAATSDALTNLLGACVWWQIAVAFRRTRVLPYLAAMWCATIAAAVTDRMAAPLVAVATVASGAAIVLRPRLRGTSVVFATTVTVVVVGAALAVAMWAPHVLRESLQSYQWDRLFSASVAPAAMTWDFFTDFTAFVHQSWWFSLGWGRYPPPSWWTLVVVVMSVLAALGVGRRLLGDSTLDTRTRALLTLAMISLAIQLAAVYWMFFRFANGGQGKSLFPVLIPCLVLLWAGLEAWVPPSRRVHAAVALVSVFALLDITVWTLVAIPAYYATF